jgi:hypothetical protein
VCEDADLVFVPPVESMTICVTIRAFRQRPI